MFPGKVAFYAQAAEMRSNLAFFHDVTLNYGNHYNKESASFTAPLGGIYFFHTFYAPLGGGNLDLGVQVNGQRKCIGNAPRDFDQGSCSAMVQLEVGDVVNVMRIHGPGHVHSAACGFSGFLYLAL